MKLHFSNEWIKERIENDPDLPVECGSPTSSRNNTQQDQRTAVNNDQLLWVAHDRKLIEPLDANNRT